MSERLARELTDIVDELIGARIVPAWSDTGHVRLELSGPEAQALVDELRAPVEPVKEEEEPEGDGWHYGR